MGFETYVKSRTGRESRGWTVVFPNRKTGLVSLSKEIVEHLDTQYVTFAWNEEDKAFQILAKKGKDNPNSVLKLGQPGTARVRTMSWRGVASRFDLDRFIGKEFIVEPIKGGIIGRLED